MFAATLTDSDDAHLTVQLLYQPFVTKSQAEDGSWHNNPIDVKLSAHTFANALELLKKVRRQVGCKTDNETLSPTQFDKAYEKLKEIFQDRFMRNDRLRAGVPDNATRETKKKFHGDVRGAFKSWCRDLIGDHAFLLAVLRHGLFEFSDLKKYAEMLQSERNEPNKNDGVTQPRGVKQPPRNVVLRREALQARNYFREAKKFQRWHWNGWELEWWQQHQVILLENGELEEKMRAANASYGYGVGAEAGLSKEQAMTLEIFTNGPMRKYFST